MSTGLAEKLPKGLKTEDEILSAGFQIMKKEEGIKTARYYFYYNEDFPSDLIAEYKYLENQVETI